MTDSPLQEPREAQDWLGLVAAEKRVSFPPFPFYPFSFFSVRPISFYHDGNESSFGRAFGGAPCPQRSRQRSRFETVEIAGEIFLPPYPPLTVSRRLIVEGQKERDAGNACCPVASPARCP